MLRSSDAGSLGMSLPPADHIFDLKQTKTARMKEWERLPLATVQDRRRWFSDKADRIGLSLEDQNLRREEHEGVAVALSTSWQQPQMHAARVLPGHLDQVSSSSPMAMQSPLDHAPHQNQYQSTPTNTSPGWRTDPSESYTSVGDRAGASKADIISSTQSRKFF
jgi:hypothetical protein